MALARMYPVQPPNLSLAYAFVHHKAYGEGRISGREGGREGERRGKERNRRGGMKGEEGGGRGGRKGGRMRKHEGGREGGGRRGKRGKRKAAQDGIVGLFLPCAFCPSTATCLFSFEKKNSTCIIR